MKLIQQSILVFQEGRSDKVYEVDLCEVGAGRYVVNFRYGRRGANLKEGTKTTTALPRADAEKIYNDLVDSKLRKGYQAAGSQAAARASAPKPMAAPSDPDARNQAILNRLADPNRKAPAKSKAVSRVLANRKPEKFWPLERAIWRAGELKIKAAAPLLINLIGSGGALRDYCIAWALGWCGDESAIEPLGRLYGNPATPDMVRRIAAEALMKLSDDQTRAEFRADMIEKIPKELRELARNGPAAAFTAALNAYLSADDFQRFPVLDTIYLVDNEHVR
ncbi:MAG TPA: HEAT repeat domain-containing protein, partial [Blastocatellia bacterium]|nr:HEAT repeat domain-containing protein [Blastocatellia bacterium]